ncbi:serine protease [Streptomyces sp. NPDC029216]|uniref:S1 family serine peptidase n=1 Tax=Streptomyces sp. NPDC029216 TaxID=3154701 RepID=UPI0033CC0C60
MYRKLAVSTVVALGLIAPSSFPAAAVAGGSATSFDTAPYEVSVRSQDWTGSLNHICGGFLLGPNKVVTAAHCVNGATASKMNVSWGGTKRSSLAQNSAVASIHVHENFDEQTNYGDVAVLTLSKAATESYGVRFAWLADTAPAADAVGTFTGWGRTGPASTMPEDLQAAQLSVMSRAACKSAYPKTDLDGKLCARAAGTGRTPICEGDDGGPLVINGRVVGIAARRHGPCDTTNAAPSVFTNVAQFKNWIESR